MGAGLTESAASNLNANSLVLGDKDMTTVTLAKEAQDSLLAGFKDILDGYSTKPDSTSGGSSELALNWGQTIGLSSQPTPEQVIKVATDGTPHLLSSADYWKEHQSIQMRQGLLSPIERTLNPLIPSLPLGSIAVGGIVGIVLDELIDGFFPPLTSTGSINMVNVAIKGGAAFLLTMLAKPLMSTQAIIIASGVLGLRVLGAILPLDKLVDWLLGLFGKTRQGAYDAVREAGSIAARAWNQSPPIAHGEHDLLAHTF